MRYNRHTRKRGGAGSSSPVKKNGILPLRNVDIISHQIGEGKGGQVSKVTTGGSRRSRSGGRKRGGSGLERAIIPFGLWGLKGLYSSNRKDRKYAKKFGKKTSRRIRKLL